MGDRYGREDKIKIRQRIAAENIRRVLYTSVICAIVIPVYILINKLSGSEASGIVNGALIAFEFIYLIAAGISFYTIRNHDNRTANIVFRSFWGVFEVTSFILIFSNMHNLLEVQFHNQHNLFPDLIVANIVIHHRQNQMQHKYNHLLPTDNIVNYNYYN